MADMMTGSTASFVGLVSVLLVVAGVGGWLFRPAGQEAAAGFLGRRGALLMLVDCTCSDPHCAGVRRVRVPWYALDPEL